MSEVERDESAPSQPEPEVGTAEQEPEQRTVHLPNLLGDEYGISSSEARRVLQMGEIEIDGEKYQGDKLDVPVEAIDGKTIKVTEGVKAMQFQYRSEGRRDRMTGDLI